MRRVAREKKLPHHITKYLRKGARGTSLGQYTPHPFAGSEAPPGGLSLGSVQGRRKYEEG